MKKNQLHYIPIFKKVGTHLWSVCLYEEIKYSNEYLRHKTLPQFQKNIYKKNKYINNLSI